MAYVDAMNLYGYVMSSPQTGRDPFGLQDPGLPTPKCIIPPYGICVAPKCPPGNIPWCPPTEPCGAAAGDGWCRNDSGHCGLHCYRSYGTGTHSGQQCCYDSSGALNQDPDCMGSVDIFGCATSEDWNGNCQFDMSCVVFNHEQWDHGPWANCKRKYNELQCCLRHHGVPSGNTPGTSHPAHPTPWCFYEYDLGPIYQHCIEKVYGWGMTFCRPPSTASCSDEWYAPPDWAWPW